MSRFDWTIESFWNQRAPLMAAAARRWGCPDHREALGTVWEVLTARFPEGLVEGPHPRAYLDKTIWAEANKFFREEARRRGKFAGRSLVPIDSAEVGLAETSSLLEVLIDRKVPSVVGALLRELPCRERELVEARYGLGGEVSSTAEIAGMLNVSRQAVGKRLRRIEDRLRRRARHLHLVN